MLLSNNKIALVQNGRLMGQYYLTLNNGQTDNVFQ